MLILQLSAGQGPEECALAVRHALRRLEQEAEANHVQLTLLEQQYSVGQALKSVLVSLCGGDARKLAQQWQGAILWQCQSPFRPNHARKNWFISGTVYEPAAELPDSAIHFQACRASGAGGQHVNKTSSAIHARHDATGISVKVQSERSQHANKRLAKLLIAHKLARLQQEQTDTASQQRWQAHWQVERGNPVRTFVGEKFKETR